MTEQEELQTCEALKAWFISQEIAPTDGMILLCRFAAFMIIDNATSAETLNESSVSPTTPSELS
jgi:hypothetical protein